MLLQQSGVQPHDFFPIRIGGVADNEIGFFIQQRQRGEILPQRAVHEGETFFVALQQAGVTLQLLENVFGLAERRCGEQAPAEYIHLLDRKIRFLPKEEA